jgi:DNA-binding transcriptional LysR family regulator
VTSKEHDSVFELQRYEALHGGDAILHHAFRWALYFPEHAMKSLPETADWDDVRVLLAVLKHGSFRHAARTLRVQQSTISRRIASLEHALGGVLFDRTASGPKPTELARSLAPHAERMSLQWGALLAQSRAGESVSGRVAISLASSFAVHVFIPFLIPRLRALHPGLHVDLHVDERAANLADRDAEIALRFFKPKHGDVTAKRVARLETAILVSRSRSMSLRSPAVPQALDWIVLDLSPAPTPDMTLLHAFSGLEPVMRTNMHLAQIEAVRAGLGVALLPRALCRILPDLVVLDVSELSLPVIDLWLVAPSRLAKAPRVRALWDFLASSLRDLESGKLFAS